MNVSGNGTPSADFPLPRPACAFILHGLNTNPEKMKDIASLLAQHVPLVTNGRLTGHSTGGRTEKQINAEVWKSETLDQWHSGMKTCVGASSERIFVGYSLGALTALSLFDARATELLPTKMILIAPALVLRKKAALIELISWLPFGQLPSLNHPDYRAQTSTPIAAYRALFAINKTWTKNSFRVSGRIPTLLVLSPEDELVDSQSLAKKLGHQADTRWKILWLDNSDSKLQPRYNHLMIDSASLGAVSWQKFTAEVRGFLTTENKEQSR
jgi:esterase/lipase